MRHRWKDRGVICRWLEVCLIDDVSSSQLDGGVVDGLLGFLARS